MKRTIVGGADGPPCLRGLSSAARLRMPRNRMLCPKPRAPRPRCPPLVGIQQSVPGQVRHRRRHSRPRLRCKHRQGAGRQKGCTRPTSPRVGQARHGGRGILYYGRTAFMSPSTSRVRRSTWTARPGRPSRARHRWDMGRNGSNSSAAAQVRKITLKFRNSYGGINPGAAKSRSSPPAPPRRPCGSSSEARVWPPNRPPTTPAWPRRLPRAGWASTS